MAVSLLLLGVIGGIFMLTTETTSSAVRTGVAVADLDAEALRCLERVCTALRSSSSGMAGPQAEAPFSGTFVEFQAGLGADADGNPLWGPIERLELLYDEADDDLDNDGDGLVDEGTLVWIESPGTAGERRVVLCRNVREYLEGETFDAADENDNGLIDERGFTLDYAENRVRVRLSLEARDRKGMALVSTVERTIAFRND
jgi:hypothetical protein